METIVNIDNKNGDLVAIVETDKVILQSEGDAMDLLANINHQWSCDKVILPKHAVTEDFFDLKSNLAGAILQKFVNYRFRIAIVGDFSSYTSKSLKDFIYESNKGKSVNFLPDNETALEALHS